MKTVFHKQEIDPEKWHELVASSSVATWFQTREAFVFFDELPFLEAFVVAVESEGVLKGLATGYIQKENGKLKRFFSRRAIILGGPLLAENIADNELRALLETLINILKQKAIYIETRNFNDYSRWRQPFVECGFAYQPHYDIKVDTSSMEMLNSNLGKSRKRDIRVSMREGAGIVASPTINQVREYYILLSDLYKNKVKSPLFPFSFFEKLLQQTSSAFLLVEFEEKIVGGTVCVGLAGRALFEMFACGKDGVYKNVFPSELATFAGMQYAVKKGYPMFDMMGAGKPDDGGYGVRDFKLKFGGALVEYGRYVHVCNRLLYGIGKLGVKIMKKV